VREVADLLAPAIEVQTETIQCFLWLRLPEVAAAVVMEVHLFLMVLMVVQVVEVPLHFLLLVLVALEILRL
jgi:hypothetical protein